MEYYAISQIAARWGISSRRIQQLCKSGAIKGAKMEGCSWLVPENAQILLHPRTEKRSQLLPPPVAISEYVEAVTKYYYVDKTMLIRDFIDTVPKVSLFTRPRRCGKPLNMNMLRVFFDHTVADTSIYFKEKAIWSCGEYYRSFQGKYPVIYLSFKDVKYSSWENALKGISANIRGEYTRHEEPAGSNVCNVVDKQLYADIIFRHRGRGHPFPLISCASFHAA